MKNETLVTALYEQTDGSFASTVEEKLLIDDLELSFRLYDTISDDEVHTDINVGLHKISTGETVIDSIGDPSDEDYRKYLHGLLEDFLNNCAAVRA